MKKIIKGAPIIGFVRYSQKIEFGHVIRDMFEPEYFEYRFNIFKNITLKSFQQQSNTNFVLLLLHSKNMPNHYQERFKELENENSFLYNVFVEDTQASFDEALAMSYQFVDSENGSAITFRIDNDDAVQTDFIKELHYYLKDEFSSYCISIPKMIIIKRIDKNVYMLQESYYPANSIGLASITKADNYKTIMELGQHHLMNEENNLILLSKSNNAVLMTINGENAINTMDDSKSVILNEQSVGEYLKKHKIGNLNLESLRIFKLERKSNFLEIRKIIILFMPPIVSKIYHKMVNFLG